MSTKVLFVYVYVVCWLLRLVLRTGISCFSGVPVISGKPTQVPDYEHADFEPKPIPTTRLQDFQGRKQNTEEDRRHRRLAGRSGRWGPTSDSGHAD